MPKHHDTDYHCAVSTTNSLIIQNKASCVIIYAMLLPYKKSEKCIDDNFRSHCPPPLEDENGPAAMQRGETGDHDCKVDLIHLLLVPYVRNVGVFPHW